EAGVKDHRAAVDLFTEEAANGSDPDLKAFAAKTLPTIKHHYDMAQSLSSKIRCAWLNGSRFASVPRVDSFMSVMFSPFFLVVVAGGFAGEHAQRFFDDRL